MSPLNPNAFYYPYPNNVPKRLIHAVIIACLLMGLSGLREGSGMQGWLAVFEQWLLMLLIYPLATTIIAIPFKYRDPEFQLKNAYYLGMVVALLFSLAKLRYWR